MDLFHITVRLSMGEDGPDADVLVPLLLTMHADERDDIDAYVERAKRTALDMLRPFLNNSTHFIADTLPIGAYGR